MTEQDWYQIRIQGWIGLQWTEWSDGMRIAYDGEKDNSPITFLSGPIVDQAALRSLLTKIWDVNLTLVSVSRIETNTEQPRGGPNDEHS